MTVVERFKTRVNVWTVCQKCGRCREVAVSKGSIVDEGVLFSVKNGMVEPRGGVFPYKILLSNHPTPAPEQ